MDRGEKAPELRLPVVVDSKMERPQALQGGGMDGIPEVNGRDCAVPEPSSPHSADLQEAPSLMSRGDRIRAISAFVAGEETTETLSEFLSRAGQDDSIDKQIQIVGFLKQGQYSDFATSIKSFLEPYQQCKKGTDAVIIIQETLRKCIKVCPEAIEEIESILEELLKVQCWPALWAFWGVLYKKNVQKAHDFQGKVDAQCNHSFMHYTEFSENISTEAEKPVRKNGQSSSVQRIHQYLAAGMSPYGKFAHFLSPRNMGCPSGDDLFIHQALREDALESFRLLLQYGVDPELLSLAGYSPLEVAIQYGRVRPMYLLLHCGISDSYRNPQCADVSMMALAVSSGRHESALILQKYGKAEVSDNTLLHLAAKSHNPWSLNMLKLLLDWGLDPSIARDSCNLTVWEAVDAGQRTHRTITGEAIQDNTGFWEKKRELLAPVIRQKKEAFEQKIAAMGELIKSKAYQDFAKEMKAFLEPHILGAQDDDIVVIQRILRECAKVCSEKIKEHYDLSPLQEIIEALKKVQCWPALWYMWSIWYQQDSSAANAWQSSEFDSLTGFNWVTYKNLRTRILEENPQVSESMRQASEQVVSEGLSDGLNPNAMIFDAAGALPRNDKSLLCDATRKAAKQSIRHLLLHGANPHLVGIMHNAVFQGLDKEVQLLLDCGVSPNELSVFHDYETPFELAAKRGSVFMLIAMKEAGANILRTNQEGCNALHRVAQYHSYDNARTFRLLLEWGLDPKAETKAGKTVKELLDESDLSVHDQGYDVLEAKQRILSSGSLLG